MRRLISIIQFFMVVTICGLVAAKLPELSSSQVSVTGALVGAGIGAVAFLVGTRLTPRLGLDSVAYPTLPLIILRVAMLALFTAVIGFTILLYTDASWARVMVGVGVVAGVIAVFSGVLVAFIGRRKTDV